MQFKFILKLALSFRYLDIGYQKFNKNILAT